MRDALPNALFIGFTGTPIEQNDANTRAVVGEYVSVYDIRQAVIANATVPIYYESRIGKVSLNGAELAKVDSEFEAINEREREDRKQKGKTKWPAGLTRRQRKTDLTDRDLDSLRCICPEGVEQESPGQSGIRLRRMKRRPGFQSTTIHKP